MEAVIVVKPFEKATPEAHLDEIVAANLSSPNVLSSFWQEREADRAVVTAFPGEALMIKAHELGRSPQELFGQEAVAASRRLFDGPADRRLGVLSERYESSGDPASVGEDAVGGPSYGLYQIASRVGTMAAFLAFLARRFPDFHQTLEEAGGDAAARARATKFVEAWKTLAAGQEFSVAQHAFIKSTHYDPFVDHLRKSRVGLDLAQRSFALKNVAWSTAVQHGAGNSVFANALSGGAAAALEDDDAISRIYDERGKVERYFPSSPSLWESLRSRFARERDDALAMLA